MVQAVLNRHAKMLNGGRAVTTGTSYKHPWKQWKSKEPNRPRPSINFKDRRVQSALDVPKGRMKGDESEEPGKYEECSGPKSRENERPVDEENDDGADRV